MKMSAGLAASALGFPAIVHAAPKTRSVILLGIDGMDPVLTQRFMKEGILPNITRLAEMGGFRKLRTSDPPQSPVAWSNVISGTNPGGHGIFDFIAREPSTLVPYLSTSRLAPPPPSFPLGRWRIPLKQRRMQNLRRGATFWVDLEKNGIDSTLLRMPANFPPTDSSAVTLSGLGTPDIQGSYGVFTFYTDKSRKPSRDVPGGRFERVTIRDHVAACTLRGPANTFSAKGGAVDIPFEVYVDPVNPVARIVIQDHDFILKEGEWSDWLRLSFNMMPHVAEISAVCRMFLKSAHKDFGLYVSPVNIDPADPALPISTPRRYAADLARALGPFYTQGMPQDTSALSAGVFDDDDYRQQAVFVLNEEVSLFRHAYDTFSSGFLFSYFSSLDLNCHAFWRTLDKEHPAYSAETAKVHGDFIAWLYRQMDGVVGKAMQRLRDNMLLMVVSDHGFGSFRRQFNLNSWLLDNGYATPANRASRGHTSYWQDIKWGETRAYGLGINGLYANMRGREPDGVVREGDEKERLLSELIDGLKSVHDPVTGDRVIANVYRPSEIYTGPHAGTAPDLIVGYNRNYRASWDTILGKYPREHVLDNLDPWSGDHVFDSSLVPGIFLCNRKTGTPDPALLDIAPTVLAAFGVPAPQSMTGRNILQGA